jgi:Protein of unknown function (DUF3108)
MLAKRYFFSILAIALLAGGIGGARPALATGDGSLTDNATIKATYDVKIGAFDLGTFKLTTQIQGTVYRMRGDGHFSILQGLLYEWHGTTASAGRVTTAGIQPSEYALSYRGGKQVEEVHMIFEQGTVKELQVVPDKRPNPNNVPITAKQLQNVLDPMSAAFLFARSNDLSGDLNVCRQTVPVFDGHQRFDLVLSPKRRIELPNKNIGYSGPAAVCKVKYVPLGGYRPDNPGVQLLSTTDDIEVWLVPMAGTGLYVPYKIILPTFIGYGTATAVSFEVQGGRRASLP